MLANEERFRAVWGVRRAGGALPHADAGTRFLLCGALPDLQSACGNWPSKQQYRTRKDDNMRLQGVVREWKETHGFITWFDYGGTERNTFVHFRDILTTEGPRGYHVDGYRKLRPGDVVVFDVQDDGPGRRRAVRVEIIQKAAETSESAVS